MHADRINRVMLTLFGLLVLAHADYERIAIRSAAWGGRMLIIRS
jgi:hypothetical protein